MTFQFDLPGGSAAVTAAVLVSVAILIGAWIGLRVEPTARRRRVLLALRAASTMGALAVVLQPTWTGQAEETIEGDLLVLVDASRSMSLPADGKTRAERVEEWAAERGDLAPEVMLFGSRSRSASWSDIKQELIHHDDVTRLGRALDEIIGSRPELGAVLVVSDGNDDELAELTPALGERGIAVHTIAMPEEPNLRDDAIIGVSADPVGFLRQPIRVEVRLRSIGGDENRIPVVLRKGDQVVRDASAFLSEEGEAVVSLDVTPDRLGRALYRVTIPVAVDDAVPQNNEQAFLVQVLRDRLRVLLVAGRPNWDVRFLRAFLKRDESIDLVSFFILRSAADLAMADQSELALIPFPTDELFREHLASFDVVIFQNFNYGPYQMGGYLPRIREYVRRGGSFAMIGGDLSFGGGDYAETPIAEALPVTMPTGGAEAIYLEPFQPVVSPDLRYHPLVALIPDESANAGAWQELAPLVGGNRLTGVREGAHVLLQHPQRRLRDGEPHPVLALGEFELGRTLAFASDSSWRWGMASSSDAGDATWYGRFWDRMLRWLSRDPSLEPCQISTDREQYGIGATLEVNAWIRDERYVPLRDSSVAVVMTDLESRELDSIDVPTDASGRLQARLRAAEEPGGYRVEVRRAESEDAECSEVFIVSAAGNELQDPRGRADLLADLSETTGGLHFARPEDAISLAEFPRTRSETRGTITLQPLLTPWALGGLAMLLIAEWAVRRRWGRR